MVNDSGKKLFHPYSRSSRSVLPGRMACQSRRLPAAKCLAVAYRSDHLRRSSRSRFPLVPALQGYPFLAQATLSKTNGGCI